MDLPNNVSNEALSDPVPDASPAVVEGNSEARLICEEYSRPLLSGSAQIAPTPRCTGVAVSRGPGNSDCYTP